eukprot:scaffold7581_cov258-Pinguiococcus_pyrenoidosus.AAC.2
MIAGERCAAWTARVVAHGARRGRLVLPMLRGSGVLRQSAPALAGKLRYFSAPVPKPDNCLPEVRTTGHWRRCRVWRSVLRWKRGSNEPSSDGQETVADHSWRQMNHIWSDGELVDRMASKDLKHKPVCSARRLVAWAAVQAWTRALATASCGCCRAVPDARAMKPHGLASFANAVLKRPPLLGIGHF